MISLHKLIKVKMYRMLHKESLRSILHSRLSITAAVPAHTELTYLQSSGTQYIDTGIIGQSGLKIEIKLSRQTTTTAGCFIGSRVGSTSKTCALSYNASNVMYSGYNNTTSTASSSFAIDTDFTLIKNNNVTYINGTSVLNVTAATYTNNLNMYMFALNENGTLSQQAKMKLYYCKIWDTTGTLVRDFIPVLKTGVYCLYDRVSQTYFNNKGTGTFTGA